jgi:hypothetical protein
VNATTVPLTVGLESSWSSVNRTILTNSDLKAFNYKNAIMPQPLNLTYTGPGSNGNWSCNVP